MDFATMAHRAFEKAMSGEDVTEFPGGFCVCMEDDEAELPRPFSIIYDGDLTAITWDDGVVTRTHRQKDDEYDPLLGTLACITRKLTNNEGHGVDLFEDQMHVLADSIEDESDVDYLIDYYSTVVDMLIVLRDSKDKWLPQLGPKDEPEREEAKPDSMAPEPAIKVSYVPISSTSAELEERVESLVRDREQMRQKIRNLIDEGEL